MLLADHIDSADHGDAFVSHGLLGSKGLWLMPLGVSQALPLRRAAQVLIALAFGLFLAWVGALIAQAFSGRGAAPWLGLGMAALVAVPWLGAVLRLWQGLANHALLPLHWGGLPPYRVTAESRDAPAGWSVPGWPHPVSVRVVFDLGPWVLVKMLSLGRGNHPEAWFWVDARVCFQGASGHHLRALLFSTRANEVGNGLVLAAGDGAVVASSGDIQRQWSNLLSSFKTIGQGAGRRGNQRSAGAQGVAMSDSDFAKTVILEFPQRSLRGRDAVGKASRRERS